jgi:hypothetical protein
VWSSKSRKDGFWTFWKFYGVDLFSERDDRGIRIIESASEFDSSDDKYYLEIPFGTPANEMMKAVGKIVRENSSKKKNQHVSTAIEQISAKEIRTDSYRRWLRMWDMKQKGIYPVDEIDLIHGRGGEESYNFDSYKTTYRNLWKAKKIVTNVAAGEFPGKIV